LLTAAVCTITAFVLQKGVDAARERAAELDDWTNN
jgi:hypothetical protein